MEEQKLLELDLSSSPREVIELLIEDVSDPSVFEEIVKANINRPEILKLLLDSPSTPESVRKQAAEVLQVPARSPREIEKVKKSPEMRSQTIYQKIQGLKFSDKRLLALRGGRDVRSVLIKDPNKELSLTVLENPKITETEIELIAKSRTSSDEAIRKIIKKREWMKSYPIILAIVSNPKTPAGIGISLLSGLKTKDLSSLEKNKNIPEAIRSAAKTLLRGRKGL
ncbi:MAG TPA: hypothetical protein VJ024_00970 [Thermodesulfovibrionales bacterium]|nr:hypothetical protein [Thermodesulfovibrionales bacterium]